MILDPANLTPTTDIRELFAQIQRDAPSQYARWDGKLFDLIAQAYTNLNEDVAAHPVGFAAFFRILQEAIGRGYIRYNKDFYELREQNFLSYVLFADLAWFASSDRSDEDKLAVMTKVWNLCEGLQQAPLWIRKMFFASRHKCRNLDEIEEFFINTLTPAIGSDENAQWNAPFHVQQLDTSEVDYRFLPGRVHFVAPSVVCIHDARHNNHIGAILHKPKRKNAGLTSTFIGETTCMGPANLNPNPPELTWEENLVRIGHTDVPLEHMGKCRQYASSPAGFLVIVTQSSQRLWVVAPT